MQVTPKSGKKKKEKPVAGEGTPKSSKKRKDKAEKAASGEKSTPVTPKPVNEKSSIKTLISNIPVKRKIKPVSVSEPASAAAEDEVEIIKEVAKETKAEDEAAKAKETEKAPPAPSIKSFFSTIPVKRKAAVTSPEKSEGQNGTLAKQTRSEEANGVEENATTKGDDQTES